MPLTNRRIFLRLMRDLSRLQPPASATDRAIGNVQAALLHAEHADRRHSTWKLIMRLSIPSGIAAIIMLAITVIWMGHASSTANAAEQLQEIVEASRDYKGWIHVQALIAKPSHVPDGVVGPVPDKTEEHTNTVDGTQITIRYFGAQKEINYLSAIRGEILSYSSETGEIRIARLSDGLAKSIRDQATIAPSNLDQWLRLLKKQTGQPNPEISRRQEGATERYDVVLFKDPAEAKAVRDKTNTIFPSTLALWVEPVSKHVVKMQFGEPLNVSVSLSYGPPEIRDIYDLDVPHTAKIIDNRAASALEEPVRNKAKTAEGQTGKPEAAGTAKRTQNPQTIKVHTVDADGKPIEGVKVHTGIWTKEPFQANPDYQSDATGLALVNLPKSMYILRVWTSKDGYVPTFTHWEQNWFKAGNAAPDEVTITLTKGALIGGFVKNEEGQPVAGARIGVVAYQGYDVNWLAGGDDDRITDANGHWTLNNVPEGNPELKISVTHPDYVSDVKWGGLQEEQHVTTASLREQKATIVMRLGTSLSGQVTDPQGKGIAGAVVVWGDDPYGSAHQEHRQEVYTDRNGIYRLQPLPPMPLTVTVVAPGWMPELKKTTIAPENSKLDFQLKKGKTLRLRFVDGQGKPIPGVYLWIDGWRGCKSLYNAKHPMVLDTAIPTQADNNGIFQWTWAPDDAVQYQFSKDGYKRTAKAIVADEAEQTIQLPRE